ncbi:MAG TPA: FAD-dependent monooxygenase [Actinomycetaceae bacterium]|nr:FAD-dependent monooxygenase [Actinomycetaceae bacterium]
MAAVGNVAVVGAGLCGLATAIQLARGGVSVDVIEAQPELTALGSGISLSGNALRVLADVGVWEELDAAGFAFDGRVLRAPGPDAPVISRGTDDPSPDGLPTGMGVPRPELARILFDRARAVGANVRFGTKVVRLEHTVDGAWLYDERGVLGSYDLVIGADGIHSTVRAQLGIDAQPEPTGMGIWRAFVSRPEEVGTTELYYGGPAYIAGYTPTGENSMYAFLVFDAEDHFDYSAARGAELMIEKSQAYGGPWDSIRADLASGTAHINYTWFTHHLVPAPWHRGNAVIIGDAAHSCPPTIAQGAAQGLEDSAVLSELLLGRDRLDDALWEEFHARRVTRAKAVVDASVQLAEWQRHGQKYAAQMPELLADLGQRLAQPL